MITINNAISLIQQSWKAVTKVWTATSSMMVFYIIFILHIKKRIPNKQ